MPSSIMNGIQPVQRPAHCASQDFHWQLTQSVGDHLAPHATGGDELSLFDNRHGLRQTVAKPCLGPHQYGVTIRNFLIHKSRRTEQAFHISFRAHRSPPRRLFLFW